MLYLIASTFVLIFLAEMGDKSQLVCMLLASRHKPLPVFLGASVAFSVLNLLAVLAGSTLADFIPQTVLTWIVAGLFMVFGIKSLLESDQEDSDDVTEKSYHGVFLTTFSMIFLAELGDKTQLAVAALSTTQAPVGVYIGATLGLILTSLLGILGGRWLTRRLSITTLHRCSGILFLGFAAWLIFS